MLGVLRGMCGDIHIASLFNRSQFCGEDIGKRLGAKYRRKGENSGRKTFMRHVSFVDALQTCFTTTFLRPPPLSPGTV